MGFTEAERHGIRELLLLEQSNLPVLMLLAKSVTNRVVDIASTEEALDYLFTYVADSSTLLHKRAITKEILFKYLHSKKQTIPSNFNKLWLITQVLKYWNGCTTTEEKSVANEFNYHQLNYSPTTTTTTIKESEFPIHLMARKFSEWFFYNYNGSLLKQIDFWPDSRLSLRIAANDGCDENTCEDSQTLLCTLNETRNKFGFFFNPNLTHAGVQGRMDMHGLVLVLSCGTLHTHSDCVGLFECTFGLMRDPFSDNNWKIKTLMLMLRSKNAPSQPSLEESETLKEALKLYVPQGELA